MRLSRLVIPATALVTASDDFSLFIPPLGSVPEPLVRPSVQ